MSGVGWKGDRQVLGGWVWKAALGSPRGLPDVENRTDCWPSEYPSWRRSQSNSLLLIKPPTSLASRFG